MPDPDETTLAFTMNIQQSIVVLTSLNDATENPENTQGYKNTANQILLELFQLMVDTWPEWAREGVGDLDEHGHYPGEFDP